MDKKITQLTALVTPALEDTLAIVDDPSGTPETKKIALSNLFLDENDMASNSQTQGATQRSIKTYVGGLDGWMDRGLTGLTVTRQSTDNPTVVLRFNADVTDYIWKGMRIKATENSIVHYFIVSADPVFSSPNTDVTCLSEIDTTTPTQAKNLIGATTISAVAYAPPKTYPKGFPISPLSWGIYKALGILSQSSPVSGTIYNPGSETFVLPIGDWSFVTVKQSGAQTSSGRRANYTSGWSTSTASFTHDDLTINTWTEWSASAAGSRDYQNKKSEAILSLTSKTTFFALVRANDSSVLSSLPFSLTGNVRATSTLL